MSTIVSPVKLKSSPNNVFNVAGMLSRYKLAFYAEQPWWMMSLLLCNGVGNSAPKLDRYGPVHDLTAQYRVSCQSFTLSSNCFLLGVHCSEDFLFTMLVRAHDEREGECM